MDRAFQILGALAGVVGVALGAFGAHGLEGRLSPEMLDVFETAVRYHLYHALALVATAAILARLPSSRLVAAAGWAFLAGIVLFSGSLYLLALTGARGLGAITPLGGIAFLVGWALLAIAAI
jgi:uncharacterized membrane protein YgdD (TMEM256/DUF423 family)